MTIVSSPPTSLPPANIPIPQQNGVVSVPPVTRSQVLMPNPATATTSPLLPPPVFPSNPTSAVSVPSLQPISIQTPTSAATSQFVESLPESLSPTLDSTPAIEFGQPLPKSHQSLQKFQIQ